MRTRPESSRISPQALGLLQQPNTIVRSSKSYCGIIRYFFDEYCSIDSKYPKLFVDVPKVLEQMQSR